MACASATSLDHFTPAAKAFQDISRFEIVTTAGVDREGRQVVVFYACRLPPKVDIDHDRLLDYMLETMNNIVESDYTLVYFHHGLRSSNKPGVKWAIRVYRELDRSYKKNVKKMIIVHPTSFIRGLLTAFKPVTSAKFGKKLSMMSRLSELESILYLDQLAVPVEIKEYDESLTRAVVSNERRSSGFQLYSDPLVDNPKKVFGVALDRLVENSGSDDVPKVLQLCANHVRQYGMRTVGIFRRSANSTELNETKQACDAGLLVSLSDVDVHTASCLLKMFFRELPEPLLTYDLYNPVTAPGTDLASRARVPDVADMLRRLPAINLRLLMFIVELLVEVAKHEAENKMSAFNLGIVFGPNLLWSNQVAAGLDSMRKINSFLQGMIENHEQLKKLLGV